MRRVVSLSIFPGSSSPSSKKDANLKASLHKRSSAVNDDPAAADGMPRLKSCMSVTNLAESLQTNGLAQTSSSRRRPRRVESQPSFVGLGGTASTAASEESVEASPTTMKRNVSFHRVEVRNYRLCPGDNPSVTTGVPLSLDWSYDPTLSSTQDFDDYESARGPRRTKADMRTTRSEREKRLRFEGYKRSELEEAAILAERAKSERNMTVRTLHSMQGELMMENAARKIKKIVTLSSTKKEQEKLWKKAQKQKKGGGVSGKRVTSLPPAMMTTPAAAATMMMEASAVSHQQQQPQSSPVVSERKEIAAAAETSNAPQAPSSPPPSVENESTKDEEEEASPTLVPVTAVAADAGADMVEAEEKKDEEAEEEQNKKGLYMAPAFAASESTTSNKDRRHSDTEIDLDTGNNDGDEWFDSSEEGITF
mmetsp:Transcript_24472/g.45236  ORF Transcript_24472/g.45236 Transcript_24472/m.45236 type:complete len:423 (-) Transcript_24472:71-1339(-)|eukprot:CAMPEP_0197457098 /NCGR_PEP_ID=MMETSP1175-20131217/45113_1 /TAXON_ID=1003142 /ORGANISM="Triceratium dubium, Strain CCMP147" /LENGTH=422 /DNA_ID=CAMNT_0042991357 /DNA_START=325 /DNA_END=1593 /DNA_ORIENTATION=+